MSKVPGDRRRFILIGHSMECAVATPQTENGFVMIALDLFAMLMVADLPNRCMIVLSRHIIQSYGPAKIREVRLDPMDIEEHTGLHRNNVRRAIKELIEANVLLLAPRGTYRFNKDYESWTPGGHPLSARLCGKPIDFAAWALSQNKKPIKKSAKVTIQVDSPIDDQPNPTGLTQNPVGFSGSTSGASNGIASYAEMTYIHECVKPNGELHSVDSLACVGAGARVLDIKIKEREGEVAPIDPPPGKEIAPGASPRGPEDMAEIDAAMAILASDANTVAMALEIGRQHGTTANLLIPGWKWFTAAYKQSSGKLARGGYRWDYFFGAVKRATEQEYREAREAMASRPSGSPSVAPGRLPVSPVPDVHVAPANSRHRRNDH